MRLILELVTLVGTLAQLYIYYRLLRELIPFYRELKAENDEKERNFR